MESGTTSTTLLFIWKGLCDYKALFVFVEFGWEWRSKY